MRPRDAAELVLLGAVWGASFLFMRLSAAEFGPVALAFVRVGGAALVLLPLLWLRGGSATALRAHWRAIACVGLVNSALPFLLFMAAALALGVGLMAMFNATTPIWGALVARVWLGERLTLPRVLGQAIGLAGVIFLAWDKADLRPGAYGISPALGVAACLLAAMSYGLGANLSRRFLAAVPPLAVAAGSQAAAALMLLPLAAWAWPAQPPGALAWGAAAALALACSGLAYVLYFRLIAQAGSSAAMSVTFLIPGFAMLWGWLFLDEQPNSRMLTGAAVVLLGTALATGVLRLPIQKQTAA